MKFILLVILTIVASSCKIENTPLVEKNPNEITLTDDKTDFSDQNLKWNPGPTIFISSKIGASKSIISFLTNQGDQTIENLTLNFLKNTNVFSVTQDLCSGKTLTPGANCPIILGFSPTAQSEETMTVLASDGNLIAELNIYASGLPQTDGVNLVAENFNLNTDINESISQSLSSIIGAQITIVSSAQSGTISLGNNASITYTPNNNFTGIDTFTYQIDNGSDTSNVGVVQITVGDSNYPPVALDQTIIVNKNSTKSFSLGANDPDGDELNFIITSNPISGTLSGTTPNVIFTPTLDFVGATSFTFKVNDGKLDSNQATININVIDSNSPPTAATQTLSGTVGTPLNFNLEGFDVDGDSLTYEVISLPTGQLSGTNNSYTLIPTQEGTTILRYRVFDGLSYSSQADIIFNINKENTPPLASDLTLSLNDSNPLSFQLNASDADGDALTYQIVSNPTNGSISGSAPNLTFTPDGSFLNSTLKFKVFDGIAYSNEATVYFNNTSSPVSNTPPIIADLSIVTPINTAKTFTISANDPEGAPLSYSISSTNQGTTTGIGPTFTYTPSNNFTGLDSIVVSVSDGLLTSSKTILVSVIDQNSAPVAQAQAFTITNEQTLNISLSASDPDSDALSYSITTPPTNGVLSGSIPNLTYTPNPNYIGQDTFSFQANDGSLSSNVATISINVIDDTSNKAPTAENISITTLEDTAIDFTVVATDENNDIINFLLNSPPANGNISGSAPNFTYTPNSNFNGVENISFTISDGNLSNQVSININVTPVNDAPTGEDLSLSTQEDTSLSIELSAQDVDNDTLSFSTTSPSNGSLSGSGTNLTYIPNENFIGTDSFTYTINDGELTSPSYTVQINVTPINDLPTGENLSLSTQEDTSLSIELSAQDVDNDTLSFSTTSPLNGVLSGSAPNLTYTPNANFNGSDSFSYTVSDGVGSNSYNVSINVIPVNDKPQANNTDISTNEEVSVAISLSALDVDNDTLTYTITTSPLNGVLSGSAPNLTYTPNPNFTGDDSFSFKVNDGTLDSSVATVTISVQNTNDEPVSNPQQIELQEDTSVSLSLDASDLDGDPLSYSIINSPLNGSLSGSAPNLTYTPNANFNGNDSFTFQVNDGTSDSNISTISIAVTPVNDAPATFNQSISTEEETPKSFTLSAMDIDGDDLSYSIISSPLNGTLSGSAPNLTYTPDADFNGSDSFTFQVNDGELNSTTSTVTINVSAKNDTPLAVASTIETTEDIPVSFSLEASDIDLDPLSYIVINGPANGSISGSAPNLTYTPNPNFNGVDSFIFKVNDGSVDSIQATVTINVSPENDAPISQESNFNTLEDSPIGTPLLASDVDGDSLSYLIVAGPANGSLSGSAPNLTYTPNSDFNGVDSFSFKANDGQLDSNVSVITINVGTVNDEPITNNLSFTLDEDTNKNITLEASDPDGDVLSYSIVTAPTNGTLSGSAPNLTYTPDANFNGSDSFSFKANDGSGDSNTSTVSITITPVNDAPITQEETISILEDQDKVFTAIASDIDGDELSYTIVTAPLNGSLSGSGPTYSYKPNDGYFGSDSFSFKVSDGQLDSNTSTITFEISSVNDAPITTASTLSTQEDTPKTFSINALDPDGDSITYQIINPPANGVLSGSAPNLTYTPNPNFNGDDSFSFKVNDGSLDSNVSTVAITVTPVNDAPLAQDETISTQEDTPKSFTISGLDLEGSPLNYIIVTNPSNGTLSGSAPNLTYTPNANFNGNDSFSFKVNDGQLDSNTGIVNIVVTPDNDAPISSNLSIITEEDTSNNFSISALDPDGDELSYSIVTNPSNGTLSGSAPNLTYTPNPNFNGSDSFTFQVNDGNLDSNVSTVAITVTPVNDAPIAQDETISAQEDIAESFTLNALDPDGDVLGYSIVTAPTNGTLSGSAPNLTYTPNADFNGSDSFSFKVNDGSLDSNIATISINVANTNDAPIAQSITIVTDEDTSKSFELLASDLDNDPLSYTIVTAPANGTLSGSAPNLTYTPNPNFNGSDSFSFKVNDGNLDSTSVNVAVSVNPINDAPLAQNSIVSVAEDSPKSITLIGSDVDGDALTYTITTAPSNGSLSGTAPNLVYTPGTNYVGADSFSFKVNDGSLDSAIATVSIQVTSVNDAPVAQSNSFSMDEDTSLSIPLTGSDLDGDPLSYILVDNPSNGTLSGTLPNLTYTPNPDFYGNDSFSFKVNDGSLDSNLATISITIIDVIDQLRDNAITLEINHNIINQNLEKFPVMYDLSKLGPHFWDNVQSNGQDITASNEELLTQLPVELVGFNKINQTGLIYIRTDVSSTQNTPIVIQYNNDATPDISAEAANSPLGSQAVWSNGFVGVWHMNEDDNSIYDSTGNALTMSKTGSPTYFNQSHSNLDQSIAFNLDNNDDDSFYKTDSTNSPADLDEEITMSAWVYRTGSSKDMRIIHKRNGTNASPYGLFIDNDNLLLNIYDGGTTELKSSTDLNSYQWHHVGATFNSTTGVTNLFVNGSLDRSGSTSRNPMITNDLLEIGGVKDRDSRGFKGYLDEIRLSNKERSSAWMSAEYQMVQNPNNFWAVENFSSLYSYAEDIPNNYSNSLPSSWFEYENNYTNVTVNNGNIVFYPDNAANYPIVGTSFADTSSGVIQVSFDFQGNRYGPEYMYDFRMIVGNSNVWYSPLSDAGIGAHLKWGSEQHGMSTDNGFGHRLNGVDYQLVDLNNQWVKVIIQIDMSTKKYKYSVDGTSSAWIDLEDSSLTMLNSICFVGNEIEGGNVTINIKNINIAHFQ